MKSHLHTNTCGKDILRICLDTSVISRANRSPRTHNTPLKAAYSVFCGTSASVFIHVRPSATQTSSSLRIVVSFLEDTLRSFSCGFENIHSRRTQSPRRRSLDLEQNFFCSSDRCLQHAVVSRWRLCFTTKGCMALGLLGTEIEDYVTVLCRGTIA